jgi:hypothetical protein
MEGTDTCVVRYKELSTSGVSFFLEEEKSKDDELAHTSPESVGVMAIGEGFGEEGLSEIE